MPSAEAIYYANKRLWIMGINSSDQQRGRTYYSELPEYPEEPYKSFSSFVLSSSFVDTSLDDSELNIGLGVAQQDIYFLLNRTIWYLRDADPEVFDVELVSATKGSRFPNSIAYIEDSFSYLSNEGPVSVNAKQVTPIESFAVNVMTS